MSTIPFTNFTKGEIAPELQARIDTDQYGAAAKKVRNFIIQRYGGLSFRPGFRYVAEADNITDEMIYVPFQFNIEQSYMMAFQDEKFRLLAKGGFVIEDNLKITAITKAANAQVTAALHGYTAGQRIYLYGIVGMVELNGRTVRVVTVVDANNFTIDVDTAAYTTFVSSDGIVRSAPVTPPTPPTPPPTPPVLPPPPETSTGGGTGGSIGVLPCYGHQCYYWELLNG